MKKPRQRVRMGFVTPKVEDLTLSGKWVHTYHYALRQDWIRSLPRKGIGARLNNALDAKLVSHALARMQGKAGDSGQGDVREKLLDNMLAGKDLATAEIQPILTLFKLKTSPVIPLKTAQRLAHIQSQYADLIRAEKGLTWCMSGEENLPIALVKSDGSTIGLVLPLKTDKET